ncbi:MAG TPA: hypothetical protein PLS41_10705 [Bacteroidales bacterium]|nr:hypothetical protein [Bacteroidales bacterium]
MNTHTAEKLLADLGAGITKTDLITVLAHNPGLFNIYCKLALSGKQPAAWRAAWIVDAYDEIYGGCFTSCIPFICLGVETEKNDGVRRAMLRILSRYEIPEPQLARLIDTLYRLLWEGKTVSDKVLSMRILYRISCHHHEMRHELYDSIGMQLDRESKGFCSAGKRIMAAIRKEENQN